MELLFNICFVGFCSVKFAAGCYFFHEACMSACEKSISNLYTCVRAELSCELPTTKAASSFSNLEISCSVTSLPLKKA